MEEKIKQSLMLIYDFLRSPFTNTMDGLDDDKSLVYIASVLSGFTVIVRFLNTPMDNYIYYVYLVGGLLLTPLFGLLVVHFKGALFGLYLGYIVSPILKKQMGSIFDFQASDFSKAKQIVTFSTIGLIVSSVPSLSYIGILIGLIIEIIGLHKLFKLDLIKSALIGIIYHAFWWGVIFLLAKGTAWL